MDRMVIPTGRTRTRKINVPALRVGSMFGQARTKEEIPELAEMLGRPAGAFTKIRHEEEVDVYQNGSVQTMWRFVKEEIL